MIAYGQIIPGSMIASGRSRNWNGKGTIQLQLEFLQSRFYDLWCQLVHCFAGTINIQMQDSLRIKKWTYIITGFSWIPNCQWGETIAFNPILFVYQNNIYNAWLYKPFSSLHKSNKNLIEILAPKIEGIEYYKWCKIDLADFFCRRNKHETSC